MLPQLGFQEILLVGVLALIFVGPKELPLLLRKIGRFTAKLRGMAQEFRSGFDELARQAELDELKKEVEALRQSATLPDITTEMQRPLGTLESYAGISPPPPPAIEPPPAVAPETEAEAISDQQNAAPATPETQIASDDSTREQPAVAEREPARTAS